MPIRFLLVWFLPKHLAVPKNALGKLRDFAWARLSQFMPQMLVRVKRAMRDRILSSITHQRHRRSELLARSLCSILSKRLRLKQERSSVESKRFDWHRRGVVATGCAVWHPLWYWQLEWRCCTVPPLPAVWRSQLVPGLSNRRVG